MPRLKSANFAVTELKNSINDSVTNLTVNDASLFPSEGPFMILVHDSTPGFAGVKELMEVGSINKNTNTLSDILRGRENTPPVAHSAGARVECVWTAGTHAELEDIGNKGKAGGYASLDTTGNIPAEQLGNVEGMEEHGNEWHNPAFATKAELDAHLADITSEEGRHGIRYFNEKLEIKVGLEWVEFKGGSQYHVGNVANLSIITGSGEATIKWQDPPNVTIEDSMGNIIPIATWAGTKVVINDTAFPIDENDGDLVVNSTVRDQYKDTGFLIESLENDKTYYIGLFPHTEDGAVTVDSANRASVTPRAYDDLSGSPGPKDLIAGDMEEGFFGEVSASEFITGDALASQVGISQGTSQYSTAGWLKFAYKDKILFVAKKPIRNIISWDAINTAKCVYGDSGDKQIIVDGKTYKVRLMRALDPSINPKAAASAYSGTVNHGSEWNRLMCQIHEQAIDKSWDYPDNVESDIGVLEHNLGNGNQGMYNDADLVVASGDGGYSWCQEMGTKTSHRLGRGNLGVSYSYNHASSSAYANFGWRPVLELVP